jgi:hydrogenase maturation protease
MNQPPHPHTLVAGIGNIFLGDDGFGCEVIRALGAHPLPAGTVVVDYGIRGLDLAYALLEPFRTVILVDAIAHGGIPGTVYILQPADSAPSQAASIDPHSMDPASLMAMARSQGEISAQIFIVGCEPLDFGDEFEGRMSLSAPVAQSVSEAVRAVLDFVGRTSDVAPSAVQTFFEPTSHLEGEPV